MDKMTLRVFQGQVASQCQVLLAETERAQIALDDMTHNRNWPQCMDVFWEAAQNLLVAAANIAKALWGSGGKKATERADLRMSLSVDDTSLLKASPILRNHFEHFDDRIEEWEQRSERKLFVDRNVGDKNKMIFPAPADYEVFRNYDPATTELTFWGDSVNLRELVAEAGRILPIARAAAGS